jgi:hypothetical protein
LPADAHDTDPAAFRPLAVVPGTAVALPQVPFFSLATSGPEDASLVILPENPAAAQLPAETHETDPKVAGSNPPGTSIAVPHEPLFSLTTNASGVRP